MPRDLHELSRLEDSLSYLYIDKAVVERDENSIVILRTNERIPVPISSLTVLMLGPGTNLSHAAMKVIADSGCLVIWCGEGALRFYGYGMGETRSAGNLLRQAQCCMDEQKHLKWYGACLNFAFLVWTCPGRAYNSCVVWKVYECVRPIS